MLADIICLSVDPLFWRKSYLQWPRFSLVHTQWTHLKNYNLRFTIYVALKCDSREPLKSLSKCETRWASGAPPPAPPPGHCPWTPPGALKQAPGPHAVICSACSTYWSLSFLALLSDQWFCCGYAPVHTSLAAILATELSKNNENKEEVVARVAVFPDFDI